MSSGTGYRPQSYLPDGLARMLEQLRRDVEYLKRYRAPVVNHDEQDPDEIVAAGSTPRLLVLSATADSIASGGDYVTFGAPVLRQGFDAVSTTSWTHPISGVYMLTYEHEWDAYSSGGTIELELDGSIPAGGVIASGAVGSKGRGVIAYIAEAGQVGKIKVTQSSGSAQDCDAYLRVAITDPTITAVEGALLISSGVAARAPSPVGETYFDETFSYDWNGFGTLLLSSSSDGSTGIAVDDTTLVNVTHEDASTASYDSDAAGYTGAAAIDVTSLFEAGTNSMRVRFKDIYGVEISASEVWLVQVT